MSTVDDLLVCDDRGHLYNGKLNRGIDLKKVFSGILLRNKQMGQTQNSLTNNQLRFLLQNLD